MDSKEVKTALKNAREAIRAKEYKEALKHCKSILKHDKSHYNALVFVGVAAEGLEQEDQALMAYTKATQVDPNQQLAWQGLCSFYEKLDKEEHVEKLAEVYVKMLAFLQSDIDKYRVTSEKLVKLYEKLKEWQKAIAVYQDLLDKLPGDDMTGRCDLWTQIIQLAKKSDNQDPEKMQQGYQYLIENLPDNKVEAIWTEYIESLLKQRPLNMAEIQAQCDRMTERLPTSSFPATILVQIWVDTHAACPLEASMDSIKPVLGRVSVDSSVSHTVTAIMKLGEKKMAEAKQAALQGVRADKTSISAWAIYAQCIANLADWDNTQKACQTVRHLLASKERRWFADSVRPLEALITQLHVQALYKAHQPQKALELLDTQESLSHDLMEVKLSCLLDVGEVEGAKRLLEGNTVLSSPQLHAWSGWLAYHRKDMDTAKQRLEQSVSEDKDQARVQQWLGRVYWESNNPQQALACFLAAAKLEPTSSESFYYLGLYYEKHAGDKAKAVKCLQRAFDLDPSDERAGQGLVDLLLEQGDTQRCIAILQTVTAAASAGSCKWGWLRLGLARLRSGDEDPTAAIVALQSALRADQQDAHVWECLGEAYMKRGSHTAALKAFTRATELNPESLYSFYQLACIEQAVGEYVSAVRGYEAVLARAGTYEPALLGAGHSLLLLARKANADFVHGRALDHAQHAAQLLTRGAALRPDMSCFWKLLGDVFSLVYIMPQDIVRLSVSSKLLRSGQKEETTEELGKAEILALASRCYAMAIKQQPNNSSLWQDLGMSYWREGRASVLSTCVQCLHKAVCLSPNNHHHWLALGKILAQKQVNNKALAQHCLIKSIQLEANNVDAWTSLGVVYMSEGNVRAANEAFRSAQAVSPAHVGCWLGQAMLAETIAHDIEAMDLFRHATQLDNHVEGSIGYGHWVVGIIQDAEKLAVDWNKYVIHEMAAVPAASDALSKYTERIREDPTAYNLWGLLLERQGLHEGARRAFAAALTLMEKSPTEKATEQREKVAANYARSLRECGQYEEAVSQYEKLSHPTQADGYGLALTYYLQKDYAKALQKYESLLGSVEKEEDRSAICTAMGMAAYSMGDMDTARTHLFASSQCSATCRGGLVALCALGLLQGDTTLTTAVLNELLPPQPPAQEKKEEEKEKGKKEKEEKEKGKKEKEEKKMPVDEQVVYLSALNRLAQGDVSGACTELQGAGLWEELVSIRVTHCPQAIQEASTEIPKQAKQGIATALWGLAKGYHRRATNGSHGNAFREALKAAHRDPESLRSWLIVLACGHAELIVRGSHKAPSAMLAETLLPICSNVMARVESEMREAGGKGEFHRAWLQRVHVWCVRHYVIALLHAERTQQAQHFLQQAVWLYETDGPLQSLLAFVNQCATSLQQVTGEDAHCWQMLVDAYAKQERSGDVEKTLREWSRVPNQRAAALAKKLHWLATCKEAGDDAWQAAVKEVKESEEESTAIHLIQAQVALKTKNIRLARRHLQLCLEQAAGEGDVTFGRSMARTKLMDIYKEQTNEDGTKELLEQATTEGDKDFLRRHQGRK